MDIVFPKFEPFKTRLIFYRIPKNASTSVYKHLGYRNLIKAAEKEIAEKVDERLYRNIFEPSHLKPEELKSFGLFNVKDYFSFCIVRNPWDRIVSMYKFSIANKGLFKHLYSIDKEDFVSFCNVIKERENDKFFIGSHKQTEWIDPENPPDKILRFESIKKEFSDMINEINLIGVSPELPHINKTEHRHYSTYYNSETKNIISDVFCEDIDRFKYVFKNKESPEDDKVKDEGKLKL